MYDILHDGRGEHLHDLRMAISIEIDRIVELWDHVMACVFFWISFSQIIKIVNRVRMKSISGFQNRFIQSNIQKRGKRNQQIENKMLNEMKCGGKQAFNVFACVCLNYYYFFC